jgi:hypothetical protein
MNDLYEIDTVAWAEQQAALLRRVAAGERPNTAPDWSNIAEEIESMGRAQARELASRIVVVLEHLIKLEASPAAEPRAGWRATVRRERGEIKRLLADSPSLRGRVAMEIEAAMREARAESAASIADNAETPRRPIEEIAYTEDQVLGDWLPS